MKLKKFFAAAAAVLAPVILLTGCGNNGGGNTNTDGGAGTPAPDVEPAVIVSAVLDEIPITSGVEKSKADIPDFYSDIDVSQVESAAFVICASGAYPDELAVMKCADSAAAGAVKSAFEKRLSAQSELYSTYTPDEMYKLESAKVYTVGNYAVFLAVSDNDRAKEIADALLTV